MHTHVFPICYFPYSLPENAGTVIAKLCWAVHWKEAQPLLGVEAEREQDLGSGIWHIFPVKTVSYSWSDPGNAGSNSGHVCII